MHEKTIFFDESTSINHYYNQLIGISEWASEGTISAHQAIDKIRKLRDIQNQEKKDLVPRRNENKSVKEIRIC